MDFDSNNPLFSINDLKKVTMEVFRVSEELKQGVYIFNRDKVAGVVVSQEEYEGLHQLIEELESKLLYSETVKRLEEFEKNPGTYSDDEVRGKRSKVNLYDADTDEWE